MAKNIWGLDFGAWSLKVVRGSHDRKSGTITVDLFDEIIYGELDCGYEASLQEKQREGVVAFRSKYEIGPRDDLCVAVPGNEVFSRFINLPPVLESISEIIRYEARQQIPFDLSEVVWDYQTVKEKEDIEVGEEVEVGLFALKKERIEELLDLLGTWRNNLRVVQNGPLAVYNFLHYEGLVEEPVIVVDVGSSTTDVLALNPPRFWTRTLLVAGDALTNALVEQFGVSVSEAEQIKRRAGRSAHRDQILRILQPVFDDVSNEIQRSLGYYKSLARDARFGRILALGNAMRLTGMKEMLARGLQYRLQAIGEPSRLQVADTVDAKRFRAALPGACAALGLLVQGAGMGRVRINMVPEDIAMATVIAEKKPFLLTAAIGVVLIAVIFILSERLYAAGISQTETQFPWAVVDQAAGFEKEYQQQKQAAGQQRRTANGLAQDEVQRDLYMRLLPILAEALPRDVYITSLTFLWEEPDDVVSRAKNAASMMRVTGRRTVRHAADAMDDMMDGPGMDFYEEMYAEMGGGSGGASPSERDPDKPVATVESELVMVFTGESRQIRRGEEYIKEQVFGSLSRAQFPERNLAVFSQVKMAGALSEVYRSASDGRAVAVLEPGAIQFIEFQGFGVVNTWREKPKPAEKPKPKAEPKAVERPEPKPEAKPERKMLKHDMTLDELDELGDDFVSPEDMD